MAFPTNWPPQPTSNQRSLRFFTKGTTTANYDDNAFIFVQDTGANSYTTMTPITAGSLTPVNLGNCSPGSFSTPKYIAAKTIMISNDGANTLEVSFDGTNVHDEVFAGQTTTYRERFESGICVRFPGGGAGSAYRIRAW